MFLHSCLRPFALAVALMPALLSAQSFEPSRFFVCESADNACSQPSARLDTVWTFNGTEGTVTTPASSSRLIIQALDRDSIVVRRTEPSGLTAVYSGVIHGSRINGTVQSTWPGHAGYPTTGVFAASSQDFHDTPASVLPAGSSQNIADGGLPKELLVCENGLCNAAWTLQGSEGSATWFARTPTHSQLSVIRSAADDILIRRTPDGRGVSAVYAGSLRGDHYSGTIVFSSPGHAGDATGSWTATVPHTHCDPQSGLEAAAAMNIGQTALMFHHDRDAFDCYIVAAQAGDATAQTAVGLTFYQGRPTVPQDYAQAFFWLHKAADQGLYPAQRTVAEMYLAGQGTAANPTLAAIYTRRADEQKHDVERRQDLNEKAADRRAQVLSSFVLGASFGMFF